MIDKELIDRINQLAQKKRGEGLTAEELLEQKDLYNKYITAIKCRVTNEIESIVIVDEDGNETTESLIKKNKQ